MTTAAERSGAPRVAGATRYHMDVDVRSDSTAAKLVRLVGSGKRVLELGCATGYMSRALRDRGCTVVGIEIDEEAAERATEFCERVVVADLDRIDFERELGDERFDVVVAGDVLEHLKDPLSVLVAVKKHVEPGGYMVASVPNVAHGSVRLALLSGSFPYSERGLLDRTHLRFFTRESMEALFERAGFVIEHFERQECAIDASEVPYDERAVPAGLPEALSKDLDARTYQFLSVSYPVGAEAGGWP
jgi:2-polyprenyl-3-methyl-5-hydroxy-6-metoxy-1,4-benzoquinol methylase